MRLLWSLPKAAPALLRHLVAYVELVGHDLEQTRHDVRARLIAAVLLLFCVFFAVMSLCLIVVALSWDTLYRVTALLWMGGIFLALALGAVLYRSNIVGKQTPFLGSVKREWAEDRILLEKILSDKD